MEVPTVYTVAVQFTQLQIMNGSPHSNNMKPMTSEDVTIECVDAPYSMKI